jgi:hypothetical protein
MCDDGDLTPPDFRAHTFGSPRASLNIPTVFALRIYLALLYIRIGMYYLCGCMLTGGYFKALKWEAKLRQVSSAAPEHSFN